MSGNVHPNPGPIFPCLVCTRNVTCGVGRRNAGSAPNGSIYGAHFSLFLDSKLRQLSLLQNSRQSLSSAAVLFISLALNPAKSFISFGYIKRQSKVCWSAEVEEAVCERRKALLPLTEMMKIVRLTSPLLDMPRCHRQG